MTDDNWETVKLAIGFINGTYSVNAEVIAGTILAGENLIISNTGGTFTVDGKGATMTNGSISTQLKDSNGNIASEIVLNPEQGFSISNMKSSDSDKRVFYADTQGNLHFKGDLTGATGSFSGELKAATGTFSGELEAATGTFSGYLIGNEIYVPDRDEPNFSVDKNGYMTCKNAHIDGTIDGGTLNCNNLTINGLSFEDLIDDLTPEQMEAIKIDADQITAGTISANRLQVSRIAFYDTNGNSDNNYIQCGNNGITIFCNTGEIEIGRPGQNVAINGDLSLSTINCGQLNSSGGISASTASDIAGVKLQSTTTNYATGSVSAERLKSVHNGTIMNYEEEWAISTYGIWCSWIVYSDYQEQSDFRLKQNIKKIQSQDAKNLIMNLTPTTYQFKERPNINRYGFIAQDVENIIDKYGFGNGIARKPNNNGYYTLCYTDMLAPLISVVQQQQKDIENLSEKVDYLLKCK